MTRRSSAATADRRASERARAPSWLLAGLVVVAGLNGIGLGTADAPLALPRQVLYLPLIALAFLIGRRRQVSVPVLPLATAAVITVGAVVVDGLGQGMTMVVYSLLAVGLPWLIGQALRHQRELATAAQERADQVEATREAYSLAAAASLRHQIAEDLHDHVGHDLALIAVQAGVLETVTDGATREGATRVRELASDATDRLRSLVGDLTEEGQPLSTVSGVAARARSTGVPVILDGDADHPLLVRAAQEALTNAVRHATGQTVRLTAGPTSLLATNAIDSGPVAPASAASGQRPATGRGLIMLDERVTAAGGELHAGRHGTTWQLSVRLPTPP